VLATLTAAACARSERYGESADLEAAAPIPSYSGKQFIADAVRFQELQVEIGADPATAEIARSVKSQFESLTPRSVLAQSTGQHYACQLGQPEIIQWVPGPIGAGRRVLRVGPAERLRTPSAAAAIARTGDAILIEAGDYPGDTAVWPQNGLLLRGVNGRPRLLAGRVLAEDKAIWVIKGRDVVVENIEFYGARVADRNGAGIRAEGRDLTVRAAYFHHNENGILTNNDPESRIAVEFSEFANNGAGDGYSHNLYVGRIANFTLRFSYSHHANVGHLVKSRARTNVIEYNRLVDGDAGLASYEIDLPDGGDAVVVGNLIEQSAQTQNSAMLSYAAESTKAARGRLLAVHNTFYSRKESGVFIQNRSTSPAVIQKNVFAGDRAVTVSGAADSFGNLLLTTDGLTIDGALAYTPRPQSTAIDSDISTAPDADAPAIVIPAFQPLPPLAGTVRVTVGRLDAGAFETCR